MSAKLKYMHPFYAMFLVIATLFSNIGYCQSKENKVFAKLDTTQLQIGEPLELTVGAIVNNLSVPLEWPVFADTLSSKVEIIEVLSTDTQNVNNSFIFSKSIKITSFDTGYHVVPPLTFLVDGKSFETESILIAVQTVKVDTTKGFKDIAEIYTPPFSFLEAIMSNITTITIAGILTVASFLVYFLFFKNKKKEEVKVKKEPTLPAHIIANTKLNELADKKLWQNNKLKEFYSQLSEILREYIENQFAINALEKTTDEIMETLKRDGMGSETKQILFRVLFRADMVKFAKEKPLPDENDSSFKHALNFIEQTKPKQAEPSNTVLES